MTKHLQKQLNQQRQLLHLELPLSYPSSKNSEKVMKILELNNFGSQNRNYYDDDDEDDGSGVGGNSLENGYIEMGALPTPASEIAKVAVNQRDKQYIILLLRQFKFQNKFFYDFFWFLFCVFFI